MAQILGTGYQRAAKGSRITVTGTTLAFASWTAAATGDNLDTTNFESYNSTTDQSYEEGILGVLSCKTDFGGDWDAAVNPLVEPPGLYPRDDLSEVSLFTAVNDGFFWNFTYMRLRTANSGASVRDKVTFTCGGMNQGIFYFPTGSV